jgi:hypothetical protein
VASAMTAKASYGHTRGLMPQITELWTTNSLGQPREADLRQGTWLHVCPAVAARNAGAAGETCRAFPRLVSVIRSSTTIA